MKNKMLAIKTTTSTLAIILMASLSAGQTYWKRTYSGPEEYCALSAISATADGYLVGVGSTYTTGNPMKMYLLKTDAFGNLVWAKTYNGKGNACANGIASAGDGKFIIAGTTNKYGEQPDVYILKINSNGDTIWTRTIPGGGSAFTVNTTPDGNFIVAGEASLYNGEPSYVYLLKVTTDGDTLWTKKYSLGDFGTAYAIAPAPDGNFIIAGSTTIGNGFSRVCLLKIKPDGDTLWTRKYGRSDYNVAWAVTADAAGNFIVAGHTFPFSTGLSEAYLLKINPDGDTVWTRTYTGIGIAGANSIMSSGDGNFLVAGNTDSIGRGSAGAFLFKINPAGDTVWTEAYTGAEYIGDITPTSDGNFIATGITYSALGDLVCLFSIISDCYARNNALFTFKIPVSGDSLNHGYTPLKVPSGMTVSPGGTISWTPATTAVYMEHVEFLVWDDLGAKDTLTFNIFVNSKDQITKVINPASSLSRQSHQSGISISTFSFYTSFFLPVPTGSLAIYDIHGRLVQNLSITNNTATWRGKIPAGRYFARMADGKKDVVKAFVLVR
jgi:hypothetical protein